MTYAMCAAVMLGLLFNAAMLPLRLGLWAVSA